MLSDAHGRVWRLANGGAVHTVLNWQFRLSRLARPAKSAAAGARGDHQRNQRRRRCPISMSELKPPQRRIRGHGRGGRAQRQCAAATRRSFRARASGRGESRLTRLAARQHARGRTNSARVPDDAPSASQLFPSQPTAWCRTPRPSAPPPVHSKHGARLNLPRQHCRRLCRRAAVQPAAAPLRGGWSGACVRARRPGRHASAAQQARRRCNSPRPPYTHRRPRRRRAPALSTLLWRRCSGAASCAPPRARFCLARPRGRRFRCVRGSCSAGKGCAGAPVAPSPPLPVGALCARDATRDPHA